MSLCNRDLEMLRRPSADHLAGCGSCREATAVTRFLRELAQAVAPARLPDSKTLWIRGELIRRWTLEARAVEPVTRMEGLGQLAALLIPASVLAWKWPQILAALQAAAPEVRDLWIFSGASMTWIALLAGGICLTALVTLRTLLREE